MIKKRKPEINYLDAANSNIKRFSESLRGRILDENEKNLLSLDLAIIKESLEYANTVLDIGRVATKGKE